MRCTWRDGDACARGLHGGHPSARVCLLCWYAGPGWPDVLEAMTGTPELASYLRHRFSSYAVCWVPAARRKLACKALADGLLEV